MGRHLSTYVACACLALSHFFTSGAIAQETDGRVLIGVGVAPLSITRSTLKIDGVDDRSKTFIRAGLGGPATLAAGYGLGSWVLALEASFTYEVEDEEDVVWDYQFAERDGDLVTKRTALSIGPSARYLFLDGALRPFVEVGAGIGFDSASSSPRGSTVDETTLYARGGPGLQLRLADAVSLDLTLRFGYASTSGDLELDTTVGGEGDPGTGVLVPVYVEWSDYTVAQLSADLFARLSIWL
jgi:hypothetical protein